MHILTTTSTSLDDLVEPVDLGQTPGEVVVLSFTDSDLGALARAQQAETGRPSLRLANLRDLRHPDVGRPVDRQRGGACPHRGGAAARRARLVALRRRPAERRSAARRGFALAVLPGEDRDDPRLAEASTLPASELEALLAYFRAGGPANMRALLRRLAGHAGRDDGRRVSRSPCRWRGI